ncbi:molybdopterin-guanine dinucleotide biosynthesis protein MobA [Deinococcus phoenicis]|uniref:Probable molybdenum cofactor guanylyltransferase n=1 Tax=Deinococcus phoenicis TaxID=1476583 RepID=A0A016QM64_9DEIO|nr:molybdenum cofactor guanylyltransferase [Deinococcus phoenicis]EYB67148.1 molybdopterin-guanine dinucleotide biosynthesis protein MobA [Deinococcus phoenicis]
MRDVTAAVTAGGRSRRFGSDKALARLGGRTLLEHVAASLAACPLRLLVAPPGQYALPGWVSVPDTRPGEGPLAGLEAALGHARLQRGEGWVAFAGVDMPRLTPAYWAALAGARTPEARAVLALDAAGRPQPLAALYHTALLEQVTALLNGGERRLRAAALPACTVSVPFRAIQAVSPDALRNVNTPADLAALGGAGP